MNEAFGVAGPGLIEGALPLGERALGAAVVDNGGVARGDATVAMLFVVPGEEGTAEAVGRVKAREAHGELGLMFAPPNPEGVTHAIMIGWIGAVMSSPTRARPSRPTARS